MNKTSIVQFILGQITLSNLISIAGIVLFGWFVYGIYKLRQKEKEIFEVKSQLDNIENDEVSKRTLRSGMVNQSAFERMTEKRRKPLEAKLETLKMERQFLLDKIPLLGLFKK